VPLCDWLGDMQLPPWCASTPECRSLVVRQTGGASGPPRPLRRPGVGEAAS
jgi:hypothetical protein